jgi:hypothetical protein
MAPLWGLFVFSPSVVEDEDPVRAEQRRSRLRRREAAIPPSPPKCKGPFRGLLHFGRVGLGLRTLLTARVLRAALRAHFVRPKSLPAILSTQAAAQRQLSSRSRRRSENPTLSAIFQVTTALDSQIESA